MVVEWLSEDGQVYSADRSLERFGTIHLMVESLGEMGWDWHVWETAGRLQQRYGLADTLLEAQVKARSALADIVGQLSQPA